MPGIARSRCLRLLAAALTLALLLPASAEARLERRPSKRKVASSRQQAQAQFESAELMRRTLEVLPTASRTRSEYRRVIDAYWRVYRISPASPRAHEALNAMAQLKTDMGRIFDDRGILEDAIEQFEFLRREYPGSRYRWEALLTVAEIRRDDLEDAARARGAYQEFLRRYPDHKLAGVARAAIEDLNAPVAAATRPPERTPAPKIEEAARAPAATAPTTVPPVASPVGATLMPLSRGSDRPALVTNIRHWSGADYTRVAIDLERMVKYEAGRIPNPDRIFFDLHGAKLSSEWVGKSIEVEGGGFLHRIRLGQYQRNVTRVVLEVDAVSEYSAFLLPEPYRLVIDIRGRIPVNVAESKTSPQPPAPVVAARKQPEPKTEPPRTVASTKQESKAEAKPELKTESKAEAKPEKQNPSAVTVAIGPPPTPPASAPASAQPESKPEEPKVMATTRPTTGPTFEAVVPRESGKGKKKDRVKIDAGHEAKPMADGEHSLIRALGLKVGKIVIDAGHGGHDTGSVGSGGLEEKALVLDVGLRLGRLLQDRLGAEVVFTRQDDTFIPLESRTAVANQQRADLFLSIHANSSRDRSARGVETYYLNFTTSADALEVAARENAVSEASIHELQDLVKKITLTEKIEESREFASAVQTALHAGVAKKNPGVRNRGVKKAPFVVLIGANMPSVLAEISFLSNPRDEKNLRKGDYRQRLAESLYRGVAKYAEGLSGIRVASQKSTEPAP
ncbi:MAG: N-acetylmuramoyl-L-alanine amidase [Acidobacteria bacterium]|nr:N-acetylmuramoyl-L-alanine amidase [Acidobacteriota bacterium]